jgi:mono/diheme cytochrome c family protein
VTRRGSGSNLRAAARKRGRPTARLAPCWRIAAWLLLCLAVPTFAAAAKADPAARGAYLAAAAGCDQCHTDSEHQGQPYAGGRAFETPFGTVFSPNITPDRQSGIGHWRLADFERALRWGIAPDDSHYLPIFPFSFYGRLTAADLRDLKAFVDTLPAVSRIDRGGEARILSAARARAAIAVIAEPFAGDWQPDPSKSEDWNRGAYLVAAVGRCADCHTPRNWLGARDRARAFSGASAGPGGKAVPNITPDPETGIGKWSEQDIMNLLKDGQTPDFDFVGGAMGEIVRNTSRLDEADRRAIAIYLKSLPPIHSQKRGR